MMHIHFNTDDLRWAIAYAGAVMTARTGALTGVNSPFTVSFERTTPEISIIADAFEEKPQGAEDFPIANEQFFPILDYFAAANHARQLEEQHGIRQDPMVQILYLNSLASNSLLMSAGIVSNPGFYYPKLTKGATADVDAYDAIVEYDKAIPKANAFCMGMGISEPKVASLEQISLVDAIKVLNKGCKLVMARAYHPIQHVCRAYYQGYDHLATTVPVASLVDGTVKPEDRNLVSWSAQIPIFIDDTHAQIEAKGKAWAIRAKYDFDHRKFLKDQAENKIGV